jgi:hypothetical protein
MLASSPTFVVGEFWVGWPARLFCSAEKKMQALKVQEQD